MTQPGRRPFFKSEGLLPGRRRSEVGEFDTIESLLQSIRAPATLRVDDYGEFADRKVAEISSCIELALRACIFVGPARHMPTGLSFDEDGLAIRRRRWRFRIGAGAVRAPRCALEAERDAGQIRAAL